MNLKIPNVGDLVHPFWSDTIGPDVDATDLDDLGIVISRNKPAPKSDPFQNQKCKFVFKVLWLYGVRSKDRWFTTVDWYDYELKVAK